MSAMVGFVVGLVCGLVLGGLAVVLIINREERARRYPDYGVDA